MLEQPVVHAKKMDMETLVGCMRLDYPVLNACKVDAALSSLLVAELGR